MDKKRAAVKKSSVENQSANKKIIIAIVILIVAALAIIIYKQVNLSPGPVAHFDSCNPNIRVYTTKYVGIKDKNVATGAVTFVSYDTYRDTPPTDPRIPVRSNYEYGKTTHESSENKDGEETPDPTHPVVGGYSIFGTTVMAEHYGNGPSKSDYTIALNGNTATLTGSIAGRVLASGGVTGTVRPGVLGPNNFIADFDIPNGGGQGITRQVRIEWDC